MQGHFMFKFNILRLLSFPDHFSHCDHCHSVKCMICSIRRFYCSFSDKVDLMLPSHFYAIAT